MPPDEAFRIDPLTAEFIDPDTERDFRTYIRVTRVQDTRLAIGIAAMFFLAFALTDFHAMGWGSEYAIDLLTRLGVCALGLIAARFADRYWRSLVNGVIPTLVVAVGMTGFLLITWLRPYDLGWHGMSMMAMLLGIYVFVPNRFLPALVIAVLASLVFLPLTVLHFQLAVHEAATLVMLLMVLNFLGAFTAHRFSRLMHEEFRDAAVLKAAYARLEEEVAERGRMEEAMRRRAQRDDTTGVMIRRHFQEVAERTVASAAVGVPLSLLIIDLDYFKQINGAYGYQRGDDVLRALVAVCRRNLRPEHLLARLGGEEFAVLLPGVDRGAAMVIAERIRDEARRTPVDVAEVAVQFTVSIGVAQWRPGECVNSLLRRADEAMSAAKYRGRNRVEAAA